MESVPLLLVHPQLVACASPLAHFEGGIRDDAAQRSGPQPVRRRRHLLGQIADRVPSRRLVRLEGDSVNPATHLGSPLNDLTSRG